MKVYAFLFLITFACLTGLRAQVLVPGGDFEDWSSTDYFKSPDGWMTSNFEAWLATGAGNVEKTGDRVRLNTVSTSWDVLPGSILLGSLNNPGMMGGVPYTGLPVSLTGSVKYDILSGDTALIALYFLKTGTPIGMVIKQFYGQLGNFTTFTEPVQWFSPGITPDTLVAMAFSSTPGLTSVAGSTITIDYLTLDGSTQQMPNNDFTSWTELVIEDPDLWTTSNLQTWYYGSPSVTESADAFSGGSSAAVESLPSMNEDTLGFLLNFNLFGDTPQGGMPCPSNPQKVRFYYKYQPAGVDSGLAMAISRYWDAGMGGMVVLEENYVSLPPASSWTYAEVPLSYNGTPSVDTLYIGFASTDPDDDDPAQIGSILMIDSVSVVFGTVGIPEAEEGSVLVYPNPVKDKLRFSSSADQVLEVRISDLSGKEVATFELHHGETAKYADVASLKPGAYFYRIMANGKAYSGKFIKQ